MTSGDVQRLTVDGSTGYVGIANTAPAYPLDVKGTANISGVLSTSGYSFPGAKPASNGQVITGNTNGTTSWVTPTVGVTSITGTDNQVNASSSTGAVTLSLPQDIATTSSPTFVNLSLRDPNPKISFGDFDASITENDTDGSVTISSALAGVGNNMSGGDIYIKASKSIGSGSSAIHFYTATPDDPLWYNTVNETTEKMTILGNGNVGIGTNNPQHALHVVGSTWSSTGWSSSDVRWKKKVTPIGSALEKVLALRGVTYNWRKDEFPAMNFDTLKHVGFIAQEVEKIMPELVTTQTNGFKGLEYNGFVALLANAMQELYAKVQNQGQQLSKVQEENTQLRKELDDVKSRLEAIEKKLGK